MNNLQVGSDDCPTSRILRAIQIHSAVADHLSSYLGQISLSLDVHKTYNAKKVLLTFGGIDGNEVFIAILDAWVLKEGYKATLGRFVEVLKRHELNDFVNALETEFCKETQIARSTEKSTNSRAVMSNQLEIPVGKNVQLNFGNRDIKYHVINQVIPGLLTILYNADSNDVIITQLAALAIFDSQEIQPIQSNSYRTQNKRMLELFNLIGNQEPEDIKLCLETLCNLDNNMNSKRKSIRQHLCKLFPGCLQALE